VEGEEVEGNAHEEDSRDRLFNQYMETLEEEMSPSVGSPISPLSPNECALIHSLYDAAAADFPHVQLDESLFLGGSQELADACGWGADVNAFFNAWAPQFALSLGKSTHQSSVNLMQASEEGTSQLVLPVQEFTSGGSENFFEEWVIDNANCETDQWTPSTTQLMDELLNALPPSPSPSRKRPAEAESGPPAKRLPGECGML